MDAFHCAETLKTAQDSYGKTEIFHSDQGSQFTSSESVAEFRNHGIQISMDGCGRCLDNAKMECFSQSLKYGNIKIKENVSLPQLRFGVQHYVNVCHSGGFLQHSDIGRRMKSISALAIGQQWDIVNHGSLHQSFNKKCQPGEEAQSTMAAFKRDKKFSQGIE